MAKVTALVGLLTEAGISGRVARRVSRVVDAMDLPGGSSDDVAGALLRWRSLRVLLVLDRIRSVHHASLRVPYVDTPWSAPWSWTEHDYDLGSTGGPSADPSD
jgi:hypothetical protein